MKINPTPFVYDTAAVSQKQFDEHMKLYQGYVTKVNAITAVLNTDDYQAQANAVSSRYRGLKQGESFALAGTILHELYFQNMSAKLSDPCEKTLMVLEDSFGSFDTWLEDFIACATSARGWCILSYEQRTKTFRNIMQDTHDNGAVACAYPLLVLDMYEHAYFLDYGTDKAAYINKFIASINWNAVSKRLKALSV
ncbi:MAG: superoxide dismutase [Defluviitaleaceae bacterium]|nr:superoxide dismutase [Defluviitaleaceae bacterium]